jgi:prephenate dehydrogenase
VFDMRVLVVGVGLIGASLALALKRSVPNLHITGMDADAAHLEQARARGAVDVALGVTAADFAATAGGAFDVIVLATPVKQIPVSLGAIVGMLSDTTLVIDVGSTKQDVMRAAAETLASKADQFVPCHPIAGRERHGPMAADADLFAGKNVVLCAEKSQSTFAARAAALWEKTGAKVIHMGAADHDAVFAAVSHLPHLLAFALVDELAARPNAKTLFQHAASGFRDFTRVASSSPTMWRDIALNNRDAVLAELDAYTARVSLLRDAIARSDSAAVAALMQRAQSAREQWLLGQLDQFNNEVA